MGVNKLKCYLAGPIRGKQDYEWRQDIAKRYPEVNCLTPSDIGIADINKLRKFGGSSYMTYRTDLDLIDKCDFVIMNLLPMAEGYPAIGTLFELGYARAKGKLILIVAPEKQKAHPFIAFGGDGVFLTFEEMENYLKQYLDVIAGGSPMFDEPQPQGRYIR